MKCMCRECHDDKYSAPLAPSSSRSPQPSDGEAEDASGPPPPAVMRWSPRVAQNARVFYTIMTSALNSLQFQNSTQKQNKKPLLEDLLVKKQLDSLIAQFPGCSAHNACDDASIRQRTSRSCSSSSSPDWAARPALCSIQLQIPQTTAVAPTCPRTELPGRPQRQLGR